jgi:hypothetical protein
MPIFRRLPWLILCLSAGCIGPRMDLVRSGEVALNAQSAPGVRLVGVRVFREDDGMVVRGGVERLLCTSGILRGRVDVEVLGGDGQVVAATSARLTPGDVPPHYPRLSAFEARLSPPPAGSTVRVCYRSGRSPGASERVLVASGQ